jgi:outer membrane protein TolC
VFDVAQSRSDLLANTAAAYWGAVAAKRTYGVYVDAEERGRVYLDTVQTLIDADKLPRSEISQVRANLASRAATRLAAQQQLLQAKQQLGVAMGLRGDEMLTVPDPSDSLPTEATHLVSTIDRGALTPWIDQALVRRADLLALKKRQSAATVLRAAAQNQLRAQLDMQVSTGYSGLGEGTGADRYFASPFVGVRGADVVGNIHYELPVGRRAAQGSFMEADSVVRQTERRIDEAARTITSDVIVAADAVRRAAERLQQSQLSVEYSRAALDNEREKLRLGVGSLIDVLTVEERLTNVLVFQVQSELAFAVSIAQLRRATGTIVAADKIVPDVDASVFLTLPASEPSRQ